MKKGPFILLLQFLSFLSLAQPFRLIIPAEPLTAGAPFRVQYVVADGKSATRLVAPDFWPLQLVNGPDEYLGEIKSNKQAKNYVFTLVANKPGHYNIPAATVFINNNPVSCRSAQVTVLQQQKETLNKGKTLPVLYLENVKNPEREISKTLFVKTTVNKKTCYAGEAVTAEFSLYSSIETSSEVEKNPGFYGFTVLDKENLSSKEVTIETINGMQFNVHTIRRVELYPLQTGKFFIDPMKVKSRFPVLVGSSANGERRFFERSLETETIPITVLPLPEKNKPASFSGGVGYFTIKTSIQKDSLAANEQGLLLISISGNGNLVQLEAPSINWPAGIEGFEAVTSDSSIKRANDNERIFKYPFVCAVPGKYIIPEIVFSFFDIKSNSYKTIQSSKIKLAVYKADKKEELVTGKKLSINEQSENAAEIAVFIVLLLVSFVLLFWIVRKKESSPKETVVVHQQPTDEILAGAYGQIHATDKMFYSALHFALWSFAAKKFNLNGSEMTKSVLKQKLANSTVSAETGGKLLEILDDCETRIYTNTPSDKDRVPLMNETACVLNEINSNCQ